MERLGDSTERNKLHVCVGISVSDSCAGGSCAGDSCAGDSGDSGGSHGGAGKGGEW